MATAKVGGRVYLREAAIPKVAQIYGVRGVSADDVFTKSRCGKVPA